MEEQDISSGQDTSVLTSTPVKRTVTDRSPADNTENKRNKIDIDNPIQDYNSDSYSSATSNGNTTDSENMSEPVPPPTTGDEDLGPPPKDDASIGEWGNYLFKLITNNNAQMNLKMDSMNDRLVEDNALKIKAVEAVTTMKKSVESLITQYDLLKMENRELKEKLLKLEYHQRRNNLEFDGFPEVRAETDKDCYQKIMNELEQLFDDDDPDPEDTEKKYRTAKDKANSIVINRIHRNGPYKQGRTRPILINLQWYGDKELILRERKKLSPGVYEVNEDFPPEIKERRRLLRPILKIGLKNSSYKGKISLRYDRLVIDGKMFTIANLNELPADLDPSSSCHQSGDNALAYFGLHSPFSNFHQSAMIINGKRYSSVEQYFQSEKAACFDDDVTRSKIMSTENPMEIKRLGYQVKNYINQQWEQKMEEVMFTGVLNKFCHNEKLIESLVKTGPKDLVEASLDRTWGCGLRLTTSLKRTAGKTTAA